MSLNKLIEKSNEESEKLFNNKDFISLLSIYINNPSMIESLYKFIKEPDKLPITELFSETKNDILDKDILIYYDKLKNILINMNIAEDKEYFMSVLNKNCGHLNLSLRQILVEKSLRLK